MSIDGTCLDVADTPANDLAFGRPGSKRENSSGAFPQIRVVGLAECGTHAIIDAVIGKYTDAEQRLVPGLFGSFLPGMLVLADRGFFSFELWKRAQETGADLLWRTKSHHVLPVERRLRRRLVPLYYLPEHKGPSQRHQRLGRAGRRVPPRPGTDSGGDDETTYRLLTTILDPKRAPAADLAALYPQRWEFETALDELKTHQRSPRVVLRSKMPDGVIQEAYGYLCVHYAIRWLMHSVAQACPRRPRPAELHAGPPGGAPHRGVAPGFFPLRYLTTRERRAASELLFETLPARRLRNEPTRRQTQDVELQRDAARAPWPARRLPSPRSGS